MPIRSHVMHGVHDRPVAGDVRELTDRLTVYWARRRTVVELDKGTKSNGNSRPGFLHKWFPRWWFDKVAVYFHDSIFELGGVWEQCPANGRMEWQTLSFTGANLFYRDFALVGATRRLHKVWAWTAWFFLQFSVYPWFLWLYYRVVEEA